MVFLSAMVFGFFSFKRLPVNLMPELNYPTLTVRTEYAGAAPEEVENEISRPIEEALGVVGGLNKISSISRAGISDVVLEFVWGTDMSKATQESLEKLELVFLPREAERPLLLHFDPALDPIMEMSFAGEGRRYEGEQGLRLEFKPTTRFSDEPSRINQKNEKLATTDNPKASRPSGAIQSGVRVAISALLSSSKRSSPRTRGL
jgi:HAE1 family hydrophobic/amphiphilic exporter-1